METAFGSNFPIKGLAVGLIVSSSTFQTKVVHAAARLSSTLLCFAVTPQFLMLSDNPQATDAPVIERIELYMPKPPEPDAAEPTARRPN